MSSSKKGGYVLGTGQFVQDDPSPHNSQREAKYDTDPPRYPDYPPYPEIPPPSAPPQFSEASNDFKGGSHYRRSPSPPLPPRPTVGGNYTRSQSTAPYAGGVSQRELSSPRRVLPPNQANPSGRMSDFARYVGCCYLRFSHLLYFFCSIELVAI